MDDVSLGVIGLRECYCKRKMVVHKQVTEDGFHSFYCIFKDVKLIYRCNGSLPNV